MTPSVFAFPTEISDALEKATIFLIIKNSYRFILLQTLGQFSGYDHTNLINEHLRNFGVLMSKYVI